MIGDTNPEKKWIRDHKELMIDGAPTLPRETNTRRYWGKRRRRMIRLSGSSVGYLGRPPEQGLLVTAA